jgi:hypothetical protein
MFLVYRHKFEAATWIDCSAFYSNKQFQPLRSAAILEEFLSSPRSKEYQPYHRYFAGHQVPET